MTGRLQRRNAATAVVLTVAVAGMVGLSFAAVPLYRLFCQVTGYGGTTQRAEVVPETAGERVFTVRFNADVAKGMPWDFAPAQRQVVVRVGEVGLAFYRATNPSARTVTGTATFNVTPQSAGQYFNKVACFCFDEQVLAPGESVEMPVTFFIDAGVDDDRDMDGVKTITLSYTLFATDARGPDDEVRLSDEAVGAAARGARLN